MHSIPAPVIKTILDYCDIASAVIMARVTKRCSTIFRQYREEILYRNEYVNVRNMFRYCSEDLIIRSEKHEFIDKVLVLYKCFKMKNGANLIINKYFNAFQKIISDYDNFDKMKYFILIQMDKRIIDMELLLKRKIHDPRQALRVACSARNDKKVEKLKQYGNFMLFCESGYYEYADNYDVISAHITINSSNNSMATYNYIKNRGHVFENYEILGIRDPRVIELLIDNLTECSGSVETEDYNALMLIHNRLLLFEDLLTIFNLLKDKNYKFTLYLIQKYPQMVENLNLKMRTKFIINLIDYFNVNEAMQYACNKNNYVLIRFLVRRNGQQWAQQFDHPFIKKYY